MGGGGDGGRGDQKEKKEMTRQMKKGDGHRHGPLFVVGRDPGGEGPFTLLLELIERGLGAVSSLLGFWIFSTWQVDATRRL